MGALGNCFHSRRRRVTVPAFAAMRKHAKSPQRSATLIDLPTCVNPDGSCCPAREHVLELLADGSDSLKRFCATVSICDAPLPAAALLKGEDIGIETITLESIAEIRRYVSLFTLNKTVDQALARLPSHKCAKSRVDARVCRFHRCASVIAPSTSPVAPSTIPSAAGSWFA